MGNSGEQARDRTQSRVILSANLTRVNEAAKRSRQTRFTALLHHVDVAALERAYRRLRRQAAPGVDGVTVESYGQDLEGNLRDLADRVHGGRYRPLPVRRTYIVQGAVAEVLRAIYEADFLDCSFGFRPRRSAHQALRVVREAITTEPVNWVR
jgi:retron-type reverse transcriptase